MTIAVLAGLLRVSMSRVAAAILVVLTAVNLAFGFGAGALALLLFAARSAQLTFAYHRLTRQTQASADAAANMQPASAAVPAEEKSRQSVGAGGA